jgi:hypothetical protein
MRKSNYKRRRRANKLECAEDIMEDYFLREVG